MFAKQHSLSHALVCHRERSTRVESFLVSRVGSLPARHEAHHHCTWNTRHCVTDLPQHDIPVCNVSFFSTKQYPITHLNPLIPIVVIWVQVMFIYKASRVRPG